MNDKKFDPKEVEEILGGKMSKDFNEANYVISFINGQPGLVVRGETPEEIEERVLGILEYFKKFRSAVEKASASKSTAPKTQGLRAQCKECGADMEHKSGFSNKTKKNWSGYFCTKDKDHTPVWE